jgi:hypothetical protein
MPHLHRGAAWRANCFRHNEFRRGCTRMVRQCGTSRRATPSVSFRQILRKHTTLDFVLHGMDVAPSSPAREPQVRPSRSMMAEQRRFNMAVALAKGQTGSAERRSSRLQEMSWNQMQQPGSYLILGSGDLVRVPQEALASGHSPLITVTSSGETRVAKLSDNPAEPISVLRSFAADNDYFVNF